MKSESFSTYTMQCYAKWNKALFEYFFPQRKEDPLQPTAELPGERKSWHYGTSLNSHRAGQETDQWSGK